MNNEGSDGGYSFPTSRPLPTGEAILGPALPDGRSLRDWFAGQAITGLLAADIGEDQWESYEAMVKCAWSVADLMLAERTKNTSGR